MKKWYDFKCYFPKIFKNKKNQKKSAKNKYYNLILHYEAIFIFFKGFHALKSFFIPSLFWPC